METFYIAIAFCFLIQGCVSLQKDSSEILKEILQRSDPNNFPMVDDEPLKVELHYSLMNVLRADVEHNEVEVIVWLVMQWKDPSLSWSREVTSVKQVTAPASSIWTPDIAFYNSVGAPEVYSHTWVKIEKHGKVTYVPQVRVRVTCELHGLSQGNPVTCRLKAGSWTRSTQEFTLVGGQGDNFSSYSPASKFEMINATQTINVKSYDCCPDTYTDAELAFSFKIKTI